MSTSLFVNSTDETHSVESLGVDEEQPEAPVMTGNECIQDLLSATPPDASIMTTQSHLIIPPVPPAAAFAAPPKEVRAGVKRVLDAVEHPNELNMNTAEDSLLNLLLNNTGESEYGIGAVETYIWQNPRLIPVGWWMDPEIQENADAPTDLELISKPTRAVPNIDLVGALWSTSTSSDEHESSANPNRHPRHHIARQTLSSDKQQQPLFWMDLKTLIQDPYQSHGPRIEVMYKAGLERATGITFNVYGICGMVVWYAKAEVNAKLLTSPEHENYLRKVSHLRGDLLASIDARTKCMDLLEQSGVLQSPHSGNGAEQDESSKERPGHHLTGPLEKVLNRDRIQQSCIAWLQKIRGGEAQIPRGMSWSETTWTVVGSFIGFLCIGGLHKAAKLMTDDEYYLILGPFAAILMLQYGLTGSPAGSPRSIFWGQTIAAVVSICVSYIPDQSVPKWFKVIISSTLAIGIMMKLGVACPPAAANSLLYVQQSHTWKMFAITILCSCITFIPAILFNNLNPKRQYPTYWGFVPEKTVNEIRKWVRRRKGKREV